MSLMENRMLRALYYQWKYYEERHSFSHGRGNHVVNYGIRVATCIQFRGNNNTIVIEDGATLLNSIVRITGNNCQVSLRKRAYVTDAEIFVENNYCNVEVGESTFVGRHTHIACTEDKSELIIGDHCMISSFCQIRTGDSHSIIDLEGNRLNFASSVHIGEHCWLGEGSKVLKGVDLDHDVVVSTGAIVTKSFGDKVLLGGIPAKVIKENVTWDSTRY